VTDICTLYQAAPQLAAHGERVLSTDELTGVQALERKHPGLPMTPGKVERREFEYIRHGTCSFMLNRDVATGQMVTPSSGPTRTEEDFLRHVQNTVASDPLVKRWHFVADNLNTHCSESLVRFVATESDLDLDLGLKGKTGHPGESQVAGCVLERSEPSHCFPLHAQTHILDEPDRNLVEHLGAQIAQAWQLYVRR
jgi:putative transposase